MRHHRLARATQRALCPRRPKPVRSCGKRRFADRIAADLVLALIRSQGRALGREPVRSYGCPECDGWHLTSIRWWREPTSVTRAIGRRRRERESFTVTIAGRSAQVGELDVDDLVTAVADRPQGQRLRALRQGRIQMFGDADGADRMSRNVPADHWVTAELSDGVMHHFYWQGRWYEIGAEYLTVVESRIAELLARPAGVTLPPWPKGKGHDEAWYNEQVAAQPSYLLLDQKNVHTARLRVATLTVLFFRSMRYSLMSWPVGMSGTVVPP